MVLSRSQTKGGEDQGPDRLLERGGGERSLIRAALRWLLALFYGAAGYFHISAPGPFLRIVPGWVPEAEAVVFWTGVAELAGAAALLQPFSKRLRKIGGIGLALYALGVWPANANHMMMDLARADGGWGLAYHLPRMIAQPLIIWAALWAGEATNWSFARLTGSVSRK